MKNIKKLALVAMLVGSVAMFMASCGKNAGGDNKPSGGFTMNTEQQVMYDTLISGLEAAAGQGEISADLVKAGVDAHNVAFKVKGFQVVDRKAGKPVAQGTKASALKRRFIPKKA